MCGPGRKRRRALRVKELWTPKNRASSVRDVDGAPVHWTYQEDGQTSSVHTDSVVLLGFLPHSGSCIFLSLESEVYLFIFCVA